MRLLTLYALLLLAAAATAQDSQSLAPGSPELKRTEATLHERNRGVMHPGDPLTIVGREQGDNDLRASTPALERCDRVAALLDPEAAHARALALYEDGATFSSPPPRARGSVPPPERPTARTPRAPVTLPAGAEPTANSWPWIAALVVLAGAILWWARSRLHLARWR